MHERDVTTWLLLSVLLFPVQLIFWLFYLPLSSIVYLCHTRHTHLPDLTSLSSSMTTKNVNSSFNDVISSLSRNCWWNRDNFLIRCEIIFWGWIHNLWDRQSRNISTNESSQLNFNFNWKSCFYLRKAFLGEHFRFDFVSSDLITVFFWQT